MHAIHTTVVDPAAIGFAVFQSHNHKVVSNRRGIFLSHIHVSNDDYTAQMWRISQSTDGGASFRTIFEATGPTNPPALETDADDNVYALYPNFKTYDSHLACFSSGSYDQPPRLTTIPGSSHGKFSALLDQPRGQIYFFSANNTLYTVGLDGAMRSWQTLFKEGPHAQLQYTNLALSPDGTLFAGWTTQKHGVYLYWDIHWMLSRDGGRSWQKADGTPLATPMVVDDTGPADRISLDDEFEVHTWLASFLFHAGKLHAAYWCMSNQLAHGTEMFSTGPIPQPLRQRYVRIDPASGKTEVDIPWMFAGQTLRNLSESSLLASRAVDPAAPIYYVAGADNRSRVACLVSRDNGATWSEHAQTDPCDGLTYCVGGARELTPEGDVIGTYTVLSDDAIKRKYYAPNTGAVFFYRVPSAAV